MWLSRLVWQAPVRRLNAVSLANLFNEKLTVLHAATNGTPPQPIYEEPVYDSNDEEEGSVQWDDDDSTADPDVPQAVSEDTNTCNPTCAEEEAFSGKRTRSIVSTCPPRTNVYVLVPATADDTFCGEVVPVPNKFTVLTIEPALTSPSSCRDKMTR